MSERELMIGDWVYSKLHDANVQATDVQQISVWLKCESGWERHFMNEVEPIPLTPEILEKNLATEPQIAWCVGWNKKDDIHVEIKREDLNASFYGVIDFVHQLQHALRLCGIEKEIIL